MDKDRKKEIIAQYKLEKKQAGIYQIRNTQNGRILVAAAMNLTSMNGKKFMLETGSHDNKALQADWNSMGEDKFEFTVLEVLKEKEDGYFDKKGELRKLEEKWLAKLAPYGEKGYN